MQQYLIQQNWSSYTDKEHEVWRTLYKRQTDILPGKVVPCFLEGLELLQLDPEKIPDFALMNQRLQALTGWQVLAVPELVPDAVFFEMLSKRIFPSSAFIRNPDQLDYLQEPDIFHDVFGHVPLLSQPIFATYMQAYGEAGLKALGSNNLHHLARLYWYTVEFGLINTAAGLRIYGSGIVSSYAETSYAVESPKPSRLVFDLRRVMRTPYRIDDLQETYFVINSFEALFAETSQDLSPIYEAIQDLEDYKAF